MKKMMYLLILLPALAFGQEVTINIDVKKEGVAINKDMYGLFFEDINFGADGGLYAELIKNRSFDFTNSPLMGWKTYGVVEVLNNGGPFERNPHFVRLTGNKKLLTGTGLMNEGFVNGMGIKKGEQYVFSFYARTIKNNNLKFKVQFIDSNNNPAGAAELTVVGDKWEKQSTSLLSKTTDSHARINITLISEGTVDVEHISLFPATTWKNRPEGMRQDLAQTLADLKPGVFRFPGGCIVEGNNLATRYQWKNTIGKVENRPVMENRWNYEFAHKFFPDYFQTFGLGFYEYFQLSEDFGAEPLPVLSCGFSCQYKYGDAQVVPLDSLQPYIDDALDLIEFANGSITSTWGKIRAEMGHAAPFNLNYLAIGNEQWGEAYHVYLNEFMKQIKPKYPNIQLIGTAGPSADGEEFERLWPQMKKLKVDLVDEHFYKPLEWFLNSAARYDSYDRKGPKVFAGEYACHSKPVKKNNFQTALAEAAFMTGMERNADVVKLATYAPLLAHVDAWQWNPDLIWFDNLRVVKSVNYYVQQLYSFYKGTNVLNTTANQMPLTGQNGLYASSVIDKQKKQLIVKLVNTSANSQSVLLNLNGLKNSNRSAKTITLTGNLEAENSLYSPFVVIPKEGIIEVSDKNAISKSIESNSFVVIVLDILPTK